MTQALRPVSKTSTTVLPSNGTHSNVVSSLPFGIYVSHPFVSGAVDQVAYTYRKLGGDVLDIELKETQIYAAYEEAVLEYSYIVNVHQAKNSINSMLGNTTGSFNQDGQLVSGHSLSGSNIALKYPRFEFGYAKKVSNASIAEIGLGGDNTLYSASFDVTSGQQEYDLQNIISGSAVSGLDDGTGGPNKYGGPGKNKVGNKKILVKRVYYKTARAMWRFFGYYGGINVLGNMTTYGQFADDSTFQVVPVWQNKQQAMAYEDAIYTRISHYSYELRDNKIKLYPTPPKGDLDFQQMWIEFSVQKDAWEENPRSTEGIEGVNNMNTLPFENIPYNNINSIGKQWIRRFALSLAKEMLGQIRGKFSTIPIPGDSVTLNASDLLAQAKEEQQALREELKTTLDEMLYKKVMEDTAAMTDSATKINQGIPVLSVYMG
tara:strand:- start:1988 stop:3283 length:1296 start_codon:yes stop_codon:yes gene_type:complete